MKLHYLKTWNVYYERIASKDKFFEVRKNDRDFQTGDQVVLQEFFPDTGEYSGSELVFRISYVLHGGQFGIEKNYCVLSLQDC